MWDFFNRFDSGDIVALIAVTLPMIGLTLVLPAALLLHARLRARLKEQENALKGEMLAKGLPAAEIERIIRATGLSASEDKPPSKHADDLSQRPGHQKARLIALLVQYEAQAGDVVRVPAGAVGRYWAPSYARLLAIYGPSNGEPSRSMGYERLNNRES